AEPQLQIPAEPIALTGRRLQSRCERRQGTFLRTERILVAQVRYIGHRETPAEMTPRAVSNEVRLAQATARRWVLGLRATIYSRAVDISRCCATRCRCERASSEVAIVNQRISNEIVSFDGVSMPWKCVLGRHDCIHDVQLVAAEDAADFCVERNKG